jgi:hypothetical protein
MNTMSVTNKVLATLALFAIAFSLARAIPVAHASCGLRDAQDVNAARFQSVKTKPTLMNRYPLGECATDTRPREPDDPIRWFENSASPRATPPE